MSIPEDKVFNTSELYEQVKRELERTKSQIDFLKDLTYFPPVVEDNGPILAEYNLVKCLMALDLATEEARNAVYNYHNGG